MNFKNKAIIIILSFLDLLILSLSYIFSKHFLFSKNFIIELLLLNLVFISTYVILPNTNVYSTHKFFHRFWRIVGRTLLYAGILMFFYAFFREDHLLSIRNLLTPIVVFLLARLIVYYLIYKTVEYYRSKGFLLKNAIIVGTDKTAIKLGEVLTDNYDFGYNFVGHISKDSKTNKDGTLGTLDDISTVIKDRNIKEIFITFSIFKDQLFIKDLIKLSISNCTRIRLVPIKETIFNFKNKQDISGINIIDPFKLPLDNSFDRLLKRLFDIVFSLLVIVFILSWLIPILGTIILIDSRGKGSIFFIQKRAGINNRPFNCIKLRSMVPNKNADKVQATANDMRITKIGSIMRKYNLDELPQFFNVLIGDMSVVGPRPHMLLHDEYYSNQIKFYKSRHFIKPGISGWAQVNGYRGVTDELWKMKKRVEYDFYYVKNQSFLFDLKIIFLTFFNKQSYQNAG